MATISKKIALLAKLYTAGNDLSKQWFVFYSVLNPANSKLKRIRIYDGFTQFNSVSERIDHGQELIKSINEKLLSGWNPLLEKTELLIPDPSQAKGLMGELFTGLEENKHNLRKKSYQTYRSHLRGFSDYLDWAELQDISIPDFGKERAQEFIKYLTVTKKAHSTTRNAYLVTLRTAFNRLVDKEEILINPFSKIKKAPTHNKPALYFQDNQKQVLKAEIQAREPQLWFFIQFMYYCFVRPIEILHLKVGDIHGNKLLIRGEISKNKKTEYVAIPAPLLRMINGNGVRNYPENYYLFGQNNRPGPDRYSINHFGQKHLLILRELEFSSQHKFYSWKHTGVVTAYRNGADLKELQLQLRHHSLDMVNRYLKDLGVMDSEFFKNQFPEL